MPYKFPQLPESNASRNFQETFGGYNHNIKIADTEFYDMKNMTGDYYPVLSPRRKRSTVKNLSDFKCMICKDTLCYIDGNRLYIGDREVTDFFETHKLKSAEYKMIGMGAYLLVFEVTNKGLDNGWYVNTENTDENGFIDNTKEINLDDNEVNENDDNGIRVVLSMCGRDGKDYNDITVSDTAPEKPTNGQKWIDTSEDKHYLKVYAATTSMWTTVSTTYVKITALQIAAGFKEGDAVSISGLVATVPAQDEADITEQVKFLNNTAIIQSIDESKNEQNEKNNGWLVIIGIIDRINTQSTGTVKIERKAPLMDFICECNNRLWGCRYGLNRAGDTVNEIYACKQADFKNWFCYAGISTDSYSASVGSDGVWTGAVHYGREVLFFKENCIHKLYGSLPSDYQLIELKHRGIQRGSEGSAVIVNETLFYKTATDIVYYDGSLPVGISYQLGERSYRNAVAGSIGNKYYICMQDEQGNYSLFVYDISKQLWHKEDNIKIEAFCRVDNNLFAVVGNVLLDLMGVGSQENDFEWYAETGEIGYSYSDNKYVGRILVRLFKPLTSEIRLLIKYDDMTEWESVAEITGGGTRSYSIPIIPRRCDHFRVRIEGVGDCKIYSISKVLDIGSDG